MKAKALRLPDDLLEIVQYAVKREKLDEPTTLRKFLWMGAEKYIAESYGRGKITLREAARILGISSREALEQFWEMGVTGNVEAAEAIKGINVLRQKIKSI